MWFRSANSHTGPQPPMLHQRPDRWQHPTTCITSKKPLASFGASTDGRQPRQLNARRLLRMNGIPIEWGAQRIVLGFA